MPTPNLPVPEVGQTEKQTIQNLYDTILKYRKELEYLLQHLDESNVIRAQSVEADWIYAGTVTTDQLQAGTAKITTAMIENLVVGTNVIMGANARIAWDNVDDVPVDIVYQAALSNYVTNGALSTELMDYLTEGHFTTLIGQDYIVTGKIAANQIAAGLMTGVLIQTAGATNYITLNEQYMDFIMGNINKMAIGFRNFNGTMTPYIKMGAGTEGGYDGIAAAGSFLMEKNSFGLGFMFQTTNQNQNQGFTIYDSGEGGYTNGALAFMGTVDFTGASVIGVTAKFA